MSGKTLFKNIFKSFYTNVRHHQVTVLGGATDLGQTISLLLRGQPNITKLIIHDIHKETPGVILDLSHVPTNAVVKGYVGEDTLEKALTGSEIVIGAGGILQKPGVSENLWLATNTVFVKTMARACARLNPMPFIGIVTEPINSLVPMTAEIMRNFGELDARKLFGITTIDFLRAQALYAKEYNLNPFKVSVPVIGGRSGKTSIPLLSHADPSATMDKNKVQTFTTNFRKADRNIIKAKQGFSPVLSVAYSSFLFTRSVLDALDGKEGSVHGFIENNDFGTGYFSGLVHINQDGVQEMQRYDKLSSFECQLLEESLGELRKDILRGKRILEYA